MRRPTLILSGASASAAHEAQVIHRRRRRSCWSLVGGAVAVYAYDSSNDDRIAKGVTVAGVDVGGLTPAEARAEVCARAQPRRSRSRSWSSHGGQRFTLSAEDAERAGRRGRHGRRGRRRRAATATSSAASPATSPAARRTPRCRPRVTYSRRRSTSSSQRVREARRPPGAGRQAQLPLAHEGQGAATGSQVDAAELQRSGCGQALTVPGVDRTVEAPVAITKPEGHARPARRRSTRRCSSSTAARSSCASTSS